LLATIFFSSLDCSACEIVYKTMKMEKNENVKWFSLHDVKDSFFHVMKIFIMACMRVLYLVV
jgi:hypothetical protein